MKHVAIVTRISKDDEGRGEGVGDQESWGRPYCADHFPGLPIVVYCDNDLSATDRETERPGFHRLTAAIQAAQVAAIVATERSRLIRDAAQWFDYVDDVLLPAGIDVLHTRARGVMHVDDLAADVDAVLGRREVRVITKRVRAKHERLAAQGRPSGGRQLGYRNDRNEQGEATLEVVPVEADAIRWAADAVLRHGWSLTAVGVEWERRGIKHPRQGRRGHKAWHAQQVRAVLTKPSLVGLRIVDGREVEATWPPILDMKTWKRLRDELDTRRETNRQTGARKARRYLLTGGFAVCGLCGDPYGERLRAGWRRDKQAAYYECIGCHRATVRADALEAHVYDELLVNLDNPKFWEPMAKDGHEADRERITDALADIETQRAELGRLWARREIDAAGWASAGHDLDSQTVALRTELAELPPPAIDIDPEAIRDGWDAMTLDERRHVIGLVLERVIVYRARPGVRRFEPSRVRIEWRR